MLKKILFSNIPVGYFIGAVLGAFVGFLILMITLNAWSLYNTFTESPEGDSDQYVTINKKINFLNTVSSALSSFTDAELDTLKNAPFVDDIAPFVRSSFGVEAKRKGTANMPYMRTEMFFEAVPDRFLDKIPDEWGWQEGDNHIPVIIPKEYLNLYNFGFAKAQGLPNVSESLIGQFNFELELYNRFHFEKYTGSIVGFSNRIQSLLVPYEFLVEANKRFTENEEQTPDRLVLKLKPNMEKDLYAFLEKHGYETTHDAFQGGKVALFVHTSGTILLFIAGLIIVLALIVYALTLQLTVQRNKDEIYQLILLGYKPRILFGLYFTVQLIIAALVFIGAVLAMNIVTSGVLEFLAERYIDLKTFDSMFAIKISMITMLVFILLTGFNAFRLIHRLALKGTV
ncbi:MAG: hypothetical protein C0599_18335 [Salinivirgaceae bacterium]|nr:MAG: hypothetical protein C0599_18335 [Salinivirgaceae bacterium]